MLRSFYFDPAVSLLQQPAGTSTPGQDSQDQDQEDTLDGEQPLRCRVCHHPITEVRQRIEVAGRHGHTKANPHGLVFQIGCFAQASGCGRKGPVVADFSWFPPFSWQVAQCHGCRNHLGWYFSARQLPSFWGLIYGELL